MGEDSSDEDSMSDESTSDFSVKDTGSTTPSDAGDDLVQDETKAVHFSKMLVYKILLITGVAIGVGMYFFLSGTEHDDFRSQVCCLCCSSIVLYAAYWSNRCVHYLTLRTLIT